MKHDPSGQPAVTTWKVMGRTRLPSAGSDESHDVAWLALEPLTGRTHQLRVHCAVMGWPIVGDSVYGSAPRTGAPGLNLHAREVVVPLYKNRAPIRVSAPVPSHMHHLLRACGWGATRSPTDCDVAPASCALRSVQRRFQARGCGTVVGLAAELAVG